MVKSLVKVSIAISLGLTVTACNQNGLSAASPKTSNVSVEKSKARASKFEDFKQGFNKKVTVSQALETAGVKSVNDSVNSEYGVKKITMADRINNNKWREFQKAFTERVEKYVSNIADIVK